MKFSSILLCLTSTSLFNHVLADASGTPGSANKIVVQSEKLVGWEGCSDKQQKIVYEAWYSMLDIAYQATGRIYWAEQPSGDYLGGPISYNNHPDIKGMIPARVRNLIVTNIT
jgi:hypothetical protein